MKKYFIQKEVDCECCGGKGQIYHTRACAEDDPSGWDKCFHCLGTCKMQKMVDVTAEIEAMKAENERLRIDVNNLNHETWRLSNTLTMTLSLKDQYAAKYEEVKSGIPKP